MFVNQHSWLKVWHLFLKFPSGFGSLFLSAWPSFALWDSNCSSVVVLWCAEVLTSVFVGWAAVVPQEGSICGHMHYASGNDENGIAHRDDHGHLRHMDTHPEKIPFCFMKQVSISCGYTVPRAKHEHTGCVCVSAHVCMCAWLFFRTLSVCKLLYCVTEYFLHIWFTL